MMCKRANERLITPDGKTLATQQTIRNWVADSAAEIQAARLMTLYAAWRIETVGSSEARNDISMIKVVVANTMQRIVDRALQVHGGLGMSDDTVLSTFYRHERAARIYDGADEVHRLMLGRRLLAEARKKAEQG
jgi:alkylation response protein AidB-like acyl-CoA dehydrogenase